jgi:hypothetical protein
MFLMTSPRCPPPKTRRQDMRKSLMKNMVHVFVRKRCKKLSGIVSSSF